MKTINVKEPRQRVYVGPGGYKVEHVVIDSKTAGHEIGFYDIRISKGKKATAHHHLEQDEILYFLSPAKILLNGKSHSVKTKTVVFAKAGDVHEVKTLPNKSTRYLAIRFPFDVNDKSLDA